MGKTRDTGFLTDCVFTDSSNNVGIGASASGSYKLQVTGTSNFTSTINGAGVSLSDTLNGTTANFTSSVTGNFFIASPVATAAQSGGLRLNSQVAINARNAANSADITLITTNSSDGVAIRNGALNINSSGNVGIGTSSPNAAAYAGRVLTIGNGTTFENALELNGYNTTDDTLSDVAFLNGASSDADKRVCIVRANRSGANNSGALLFYTKNSGTFGERMRITSAGNVLINRTTSFWSGINSFEINGVETLIGMTNGSTSYGYVYHNGTNLYLSNDRTGVSGNVIFNINGNERMRITADGNVGIGTAGDTSYRLYVKGVDSGSSNWAFLLQNSSGTVLQRVRNDGAFFTNIFTYNNTVTSGVRTVYMDSGYALGGLSSIRASKKNIENILNVDWVYQLNPVTFNYRKKDEDGEYTEEFYDELIYGLIAEDTAPIADFLINYNDKEDGTKEMVGIEYSRLITPLLKAIQEQNQLISELSDKVSALENKA